jgi:nucleotide-binding universal stress UspA family protein
MRSILVTVDDTPSSAAARRVALTLARQTGASIKGVTGVDMSDLDGAELAPIGAMEYAYDRLRHREQRARARRARIAELPASFESGLAAEGAQASCRVLEADIRDEMLRMTETCDLVVTGQDAEFHLEALGGVTPLVECIVAQGCRPVIVTGPEVRESGPVLVAYDGSAAAAKALQLATLLGILESSSVRVVSICPDRDLAVDTATRARDFLKVHDIAADIDAVGSSDHPADILRSHAATIGARMLVMGAFGHRGLREMLFGSSTRRLFDSPPLPLFVHH